MNKSSNSSTRRNSSLRDFLYNVQDDKDSKQENELTSQFDDRKNILNLKIVVCIDISGSISNEQYRSFMTSLDRIRGLSMIKVIETDTKVVSMYDYFKNRTGKVFNFKGGGGTNFSEAMQKSSLMKPDAIVLFTDGADSGNLTELDIPTAVVLTKDGSCRYEWMQVCSRVDK
jgi:predicted metal-dependent peptidase